MNKIKEVFIEEEKIYLKKSLLGWGVVHPNRNDDGSINWKNFITGGSWWNLIFVIIMVVLILLCVNEYSQAVKVANECLKLNWKPNLNISNLTISK